MRVEKDDLYICQRISLGWKQQLANEFEGAYNLDGRGLSVQDVTPKGGVPFEAFDY